MNKKFTSHSAPLNQLYEKLESREEGLSSKEAEEKIRKTGLNIIKKEGEKSLLKLLIDQVNNPVIFLLTIATLISFIFGDYPEAIAIIVVIILNTAIGFWMEYQARVSVDALKKMDKLKASVKRNNQTLEINADQIVPGDIIELEAGDIVPADSRVIFSKELASDESTLTGESLPVEKKECELEEDIPLADRVNMVHKGTAITNGKAVAIVTATGSNTQIGIISSMVSGEDKETIPLNVKLRKLARHLIWVTVGLAAIFFVFGWIAGKEIYLLLQTAIAWTIAAIPEGLPIVASIALARGMLRLAKKNVIVKRLAAVETLGETTVIFTDKTGTLTENKLTLNSIEYRGKRIDSKKLHNLLAPEAIKKNSSKHNSVLQHFARISVLCNDAEKKED